MLSYVIFVFWIVFCHTIFRKQILRSTNNDQIQYWYYKTIYFFLFWIELHFMLRKSTYPLFPGYLLIDYTRKKVFTFKSSLDIWVLYSSSCWLIKNFLNHFKFICTLLSYTSLDYYILSFYFKNQKSFNFFNHTF